MAIYRVQALDLVEGKSFEAKLKVWEVTTLVEGAKMRAQGVAYLCTKYKKDLTDKLYKFVKSVDWVMKKCLGRMKKWLEKELSAEDLFKWARVCEG